MDKQIKDCNFLVTGGSGFIGGNLVKKIKELGGNVTEYSLSVGLDILDKDQLKQYIKLQFDCIYNLVGYSGSAKVDEDEKFLALNTKATELICRLILEYSPKTKLILSSTRLEYGEPKYLPVNESHPTKPLSIYGLTKLKATEIAMEYYKRGLDVVVFRISNVYGPHPKRDFSGYNVINHFIDMAQKGETITIYGKGDQQRDYIYIDDLIDAFILAFIKPVSGQIYNLGYGRSISFKDMVELIVKLAGNGVIKYSDWPKNFALVETGSYVTDLTKIKNDLKFDPKIGFEEGIKRTLEY